MAVEFPNPSNPAVEIPQAAADAGATAATGGLTPLDHMLQAMRDPAQPEERRDRMAVAAAPYVHARRVRTVVTGEKDAPPVTVIVREIVGPSGDAKP